MSLEALKQLRERTGASLPECKKALADAGGDVERAVRLLTPPAARAKLLTRLQDTRLDGSGLGFGCVGEIRFPDAWAVEALWKSLRDLAAERPAYAYLGLRRLSAFDLAAVEAGRPVPFFYGRLVRLAVRDQAGTLGRQAAAKVEAEWGPLLGPALWQRLGAHADVGALAGAPVRWHFLVEEGRRADLFFGSVARAAEAVDAPVRGTLAVDQVVASVLDDEPDRVRREALPVRAERLLAGASGAVPVDLGAVDEGLARRLAALGEDATPGFFALEPDALAAP